MVCEKERIEFLAVAIFSFAYSKTEMAAAFLYINEENIFGAYCVPLWTFLFSLPSSIFCRFVIKFSCIFMRKFSKEVTEWNL